MTQRSHPQKRPSTTDSPFAWVLRDPCSLEELRRTVVAWSHYIDRSVQSDDPFLRESAQMALIRRAAAHTYLEEYQAAVADVDVVLAEAKNAAVQYKALEIRAILQEEQGDDAGMLATFAELWPLSQASDDPPEERVELLLARGKCYGRLHQYEEAINDCTQVLSLNVECAEAWCWRGLAHAYLKEEDQAVADATQAIALQPDATFYRIRGVILRLANHFAESLSDLLHAEALSHDDPWIEQSKQETLCKWLLCRGDHALEEMEAVLASPVVAPRTPPPPVQALVSSGAAVKPAPRHVKASPKRPSARGSQLPPPEHQRRFF